MNIPVDEMLSELKTVLEQIDREPTFANFDRVQKETTRLERTCEDDDGQLAKKYEQRRFAASA